jgi:CBS domain-containing protein
MQTIDKLMSRDVTTASVNDVIGPLRDLMIERGIHAVPVLDGTATLAGIVTSSDLVEEWPPQMGVRTVMSTAVHTAGRHTTIVDAARMMVERRIHHLVVVERGAVIGLVSSFDVMRHLAGEVERLVTAATGVLHAAVGDVIVIRPMQLGGKDRRATVVEVHGSDGTGPFTVRWSDDPHDEPHLTLFFPGNDAYVESSLAR